MLTQLRWSAFGLRGRIVGAVLVTTVATLAVAAIGLLPKLESSLRSVSKATLSNDVDRATTDLHDIRFLYSTFLYRTYVARGKAKIVQKRVELADNELGSRLGATHVILDGFIDQSGQGKPIDSADPDAVPANASPEVIRALGTRQPIYTLGSSDVRAVIPIGGDAVLLVRKSLDEIPGAVKAVRRAFTIAALAGLVLTLFLAIPLAATLVRRLQRLRQAALRIAVDGAVADVPVDRARDEVGDLARSFAIMQRRLSQQEAARRAFVATASHELRTPLASLDGMLELLADDLRDNEPDLNDANALLERARAQSRRLGRLAADLLDLSRIDADVALRSEPVELGELSRAVVAEFEIASAERGVSSALDGPDGAVWAMADPGSVARILRILLDNAFRVSPRDSAVNVRLSAFPKPTLSVIDRGPGVAPEERRLIFERFKRGRDTGGEAGFGLGLAIGRELAGRMGGLLVLEDSAGLGAAFTLTLPAARAPIEDPVPTTTTP